MTDPNAGLPPMPPTPAGAVSALDVGAAQGFGGTPPAPKPAPKALPVITPDNNPSEGLEEVRERLAKERGARVSLSAPNRKLETQPIPGYHQHWFLERNVPKALRGWYEFVRPEDVPTMDRSIGGRTEGTTSEDLGGARITQIAGVNESGQPEQLVLMKIRQEFFNDEQQKLAERNLSIIRQIFQKKAPIKAPEESQADYDKRYSREAVIDMTAGRFRKVESKS
jgi:hypothetical protein